MLTLCINKPGYGVAYSNNNNKKEVNVCWAFLWPSGQGDISIQCIVESRQNRNRILNSDIEIE